MTNEIIDKLNRHIAKGLTEEADVVYVLVQLGKLIGKLPQSDIPLKSCGSRQSACSNSS